MSLMKFAVVLQKDEDSEYGVTVPDVPRCFSAGTTVTEALESVEQALAFHLEGLVVDGEEPPSPTCIDEHRNNPDYAGGVWAVVEIDITPYFGKAVQLNATLRERSA